MSQIITVPFTENFLPHVVGHAFRYWQKHKDLSRLCLVFGGRRPSLFIKKELAGKIGRPFVPPRFFTIDEWMAYVAYGQERPPQGSDLDHCYTIYKLAMNVCPWVCRGRETFALFLPWAREILHFIEQLDLEDVPSGALESIRHHAEIGFSVPEDINKLLAHLSSLRQAYHEELGRALLAPRGYQYRQAAARAGECDLTPFDEILFCNFFYLHRTENTVIKNIYDRGNAVLFMQGDQRRWPALSRIAKTFGVPVTEGAEVKPTRFHLNIYEAFSSHAQAGLVHEILGKVPDLRSTVIVLPNPDFLPVLLTAVGGGIDEFNISMGYPLKRSALYTLLSLCLQAQNRRKEGLYYAHDYLAVLGHPFVKSLDNGLVVRIESALKGEVMADVSGRLFFGLSDVMADERLLEKPGFKNTLGLMHEAFFKIFENLKTASDLAGALQRFVEFMQTHGTMEKYPLNDEIALRMLELADELKTCSFAQEIFGPRDLFKVLEDRLALQMVAFSGSPLRGLQILGLFETRSLNFKNVIVVDVNEGFLPSLNIYEPLIPREVMIKLNLDRLELEEEIQRYGFMRLISGADNVHLVYQQSNDRTRSRFLEELIWEQEQRSGKIGAVDIVRGAFAVSVEKAVKSVPKAPAMADFLKTMKFSASSLNVYLHNPYAFYVRYVLGLKPKDDLLDDPESRHVGTFVHDLFQEAFGLFQGKKPVLDPSFRKYFRKIYESRFEAVFGKAGRSDTFLTETVLRTRLERFLDQEALRCRREVQQVLYVERSFDDVIDLNGKQVRLTYRVDRVDELADGTVLIIDYKTGSMDARPKDIPEDRPLSRQAIRDCVRSFQMPLYMHLLRRQFPGRPINCALYHLRTMEMEKFLKPEQAVDVDGLLGRYLKALDFIVEEIYNLEIPFVDDAV